MCTVPDAYSTAQATGLHRRSAASLTDFKHPVAAGGAIGLRLGLAAASGSTRAAQPRPPSLPCPAADIARRGYSKTSSTSQEPTGTCSSRVMPRRSVMPIRDRPSGRVSRNGDSRQWLLIDVELIQPQNCVRAAAAAGP